MAFGALFGELSIHPFSPNLPDKPEVIILDYSDGQSAGADRHLARRRDLPRDAAAGHHPARQGRAGGRRRHAVRQHECGLSRPLRAHEAAHPRPGGAARLQAVAAAVRRRATAPSCASSRTISPIPGIPWCASIRCRAGGCSTSTSSSACASRTSRPTRATRCCDFLYRQATIPEYQLRVKWQPNTLVMWDNRSVQHYAAHDYYPARRTMERVTVKGDRPMGVERRLHARQRGRPTAP